MKRQLSYDTDKFPAMAGIASTFSASPDNCGSRKYCAGLWMDDLLFTRIGEWERSSKYVGPSWSWAAFKGRVSWPITDAERSSSGQIPPLDTVRVIDCNIRLAHPDNPFGQVLEGTSLTLWAHPVELRRTGEKVGKLTDIYSLSAIPSAGKISCDTTKLRADCDFDTNYSKPHDVLGLFLAAGRIPMQDRRMDNGVEVWCETPTLNWTELFGILVSTLGSDSRVNGYQRVGSFCIRGLCGAGKEIVNHRNLFCSEPVS